MEKDSKAMEVWFDWLTTMQKNFLCLSVKDPPTLYLQPGVTRFFAKLLKKKHFYTWTIHH